MNHTCILQLFIDKVWRDAAAIEITGDIHRGVSAPTYLVYLPEYVINYWERTDAAALSVNNPVNLIHHYIVNVFGLIGLSQQMY